MFSILAIISAMFWSIRRVKIALKRNEEEETKSFGTRLIEPAGYFIYIIKQKKYCINDVCIGKQRRQNKRRKRKLYKKIK